MSSQQIIVASAHPYLPAMRLGTSYLAEALARRGWDVLFLDQPTSMLHLLHPKSRAMARQKFRRAMGGFHGAQEAIAMSGGGSVRELRLAAWWPHVNVPFFRSEFVLDHWWRATFPSLSRQIERHGFKGARVMLFDSPYFHSMARGLGLASIYRYADRIQCFPEVTPAMIVRQQTVFREAALVLHTSKALLEDMGGRSGPNLYLPNGVDIRPYQHDWPEPAELRAIPRPRVIYAGTIGAWFDWAALKLAAEYHTALQFVLLGKATCAIPRNLPANIHLLGEVPFSRVPSFLNHCDEGIIPFDAEGMPELVDAINPLKLYEYCAAGLPVVSYASAEIEPAENHVALYRTRDEFAHRVGQVLADDNPAKRMGRKAWAQDMSWDRRGEDLERAILEVTR
jgi:glycosyltransferase involved in cell wall biosynthesis